MRESKSELQFKPELLDNLVKETQALLEPHGVKAETVSTAFRQAILEAEGTIIGNCVEELRSRVLGIILWKIFAKGSALWITSQTQSGNTVPSDLMVAAYSVWKNAVNLAAKQGIDSAAAAETLVLATHATADRIFSNGGDKSISAIRDIRNYLFTAFMHSISRTAKLQGSRQTDYVDMGECISKWEFSDEGAFLGALESGILSRELLNAMPPKGRSVAIARYVLGYSWEETADSLDTSINAAQKALSSGVRNALGVCMRELQKMGYAKIAEIENHLMEKNKKPRFKRRRREAHGHG